MRPLLISHDLTLTGAPRVLVDLAVLLRRYGAQPDLGVYRTDIPGAPALLEDLCRGHVSIVELPDLDADPEARRRILSDYDVIVVNTVVPHPWLNALIEEDTEGIGSRLAARTLWWIHEIDPQYMTDHLAEPFRRVRCVVFDSHAGRSTWLEEPRWPDPAQSEVIHPAVPASLMESAETAVHLAVVERSGIVSSRREQRAHLGIEESDFVVLFLGSVQRHKGVHEVLRSFLGLGPPDSGDCETQAAGEAHLVLVGMDEHGDSELIKEFIARLPDSDRRRIHLSPLDPDVSKWYAAADVFVQNTHPPGEMFGRVTIEAMAHGLPVLASDRGGSVEIVLHGQTGWLHPFNDVALLTQRLEHLRRSPRLCRRIGRAGRRRVKELFGERTMLARWNELLEHASSAPRLRIVGWEAGPPSPFPHMEAHVCWHRGRMWMFGGFRKTWWDLDRRSTVWDPEAEEWGPGPKLPDDEEHFPLTHAALASDDDFVFVVSGQPGPRYSAATPAAWALHPATNRWQRLPDLPVARYNAAGCVFGGELHVFGGNREDRTSHAPEHWVLSLPGRGDERAVSEEERIEARWTALGAGSWRRGRDQPVLGDHCGQWFEGGSNASLHLVGGEHGHAGHAQDDERDAPGGSYVANPYLMRHDFSGDCWSRLADLPLPVHHIEHQVVALGGRLLVVLGGATHGSRVTDRIQVYDRVHDRWSHEDARLPEPLIGAVCWVQDDRIFVQGGQTVLSAEDRRPGEVLSNTWIGRYELL